MIRFGPAGNSESFYNEGNTRTFQMPKWIKERGLDIFEYSFGRGVSIGEETARDIGNEAILNGIEISVHAPYYINFANPDTQKSQNSFMYLLQSLRALKWFSGKRCVFHSGTEGKMERAEAFALIIDRLTKFKEIKRAEGFEDLIICPETMGKLAQIGTVSEIVEICKIDESYYPCIDFGHINAREGGSLKNSEDFEKIILYMLNEIGSEKTKNMHIHFSKIQYSAKGEVRHLTFEDDEYGPNFLPLAEVLYKHKLTPFIICESAGTQAEDAKIMRDIYDRQQNML